MLLYFYKKFRIRVDYNKRRKVHVELILFIITKSHVHACTDHFLKDEYSMYDEEMKENIYVLCKYKSFFFVIL